MIGVPVFTVLAAFCAFGWNYYGLKIKNEEKKTQSSSKPQTIQNVFVEGDVVYGNKNINHISKKTNEKTNEKAKVEEAKVEKIKTESLAEDVLLDIYNMNDRPNPYFKYKNGDLDFQYLINAVGNSVGYLLSTTFTLVKTENGKPNDFKIFNTTELGGNDLIYKDKPIGFGKQVTNFVEVLLNNSFVVIDIKYTNTKRTHEFVLRKMYMLDKKYANTKVPEASRQQFKIIDEYLKNEKNTVGVDFKLNDKTAYNSRSRCTTSPKKRF